MGSSMNEKVMPEKEEKASNLSVRNMSRTGSREERIKSLLLILFLSTCSVLIVIAIWLLKEQSWFLTPIALLGLCGVYYWEKLYLEINDYAIVHLFLVLNAGIYFALGLTHVFFMLPLILSLCLVSLFFYIIYLFFANLTLIKLSNFLLGIFLIAIMSVLIIYLAAEHLGTIIRHVSAFTQNKFYMIICLSIIFVPLLLLVAYSRRQYRPLETGLRVEVIPVTDYQARFPNKNSYFRLLSGDLPLRNAFWEFYFFLPVILGLFSTILLLLVQKYLVPAFTKELIFHISIGVAFLFSTLGLIGIVRCISNVSLRLWQYVMLPGIAIHVYLLYRAWVAASVLVYK